MNKEQLSEQAAETLKAYRTFLSTPEGELVLSDLMKSCFYSTSTISDNPHITSFNEGQRAVILRIIQTANLSPEQINKVTGRAEVGKDLEFDEFGLLGDGGTDV